MIDLPKALEEIIPGQVVWLGVPHDQNSSFMSGAAEAPAAVRRVISGDSANGCTESGLDIWDTEGFSDLGDLVFGEDASPNDIESYLAIEGAIEAVLNKDVRLIAIGEDHAVTYPIVKATSRRHTGLKILHFDAHPDLYDILDGNRYMHACPFARIMEAELAAGLIQVGIRTMNPHQQMQADRFGSSVIDMATWYRDPVGTRQGIQEELAGAPVYISLDLDVFDPAAAPGVSHHEPGGVMPRQVLDLIQTLDLDLVGADVVELNPRRDHHDQTAMLAYKLLKELTGKLLMGSSGPTMTP